MMSSARIPTEASSSSSPAQRSRCKGPLAVSARWESLNALTGSLPSEPARERSWAKVCFGLPRRVCGETRGSGACASACQEGQGADRRLCQDRSRREPGCSPGIPHEVCRGLSGPAGLNCPPLSLVNERFLPGIAVTACLPEDRQKATEEVLSTACVRPARSRLPRSSPLSGSR